MGTDTSVLSSVGLDLPVLLVGHGLLLDKSIFQIATFSFTVSGNAHQLGLPGVGARTFLTC